MRARKEWMKEWIKNVSFVAYNNVSWTLMYSVFMGVLAYTMEADGLHILHLTAQILIFITSPPASSPTTVPPLMFTGNESAA